MIYPNSKVELISQIRSFFDVNPVPSPNDLVVGNSGECLEIKMAFLNKKWPDVPKADVTYHNSALSFLIPSAFRYYLPAFMILMLEDIEEADFAATSLVQRLTLPIEIDSIRLMHFVAQSGGTNTGIGEFLLEELKESTRNVHLFIDNMHRFSKGQAACIHSFLRVIYQNHSEYYANAEPIVAIERYWFQYPEIV